MVKMLVENCNTVTSDIINKKWLGLLSVKNCLKFLLI